MRHTQLICECQGHNCKRKSSGAAIFSFYLLFLLPLLPVLVLSVFPSLFDSSLGLYVTCRNKKQGFEREFDYVENPHVTTQNMSSIEPKIKRKERGETKKSRERGAKKEAQVTGRVI